MKIHNTRSPEQWRILNTVIDSWDGKRIIDLGCGYADILYMALQEGAAVTGVDMTNHRPMKFGTYVELGIDQFLKRGDDEYDVGVCFSVLPYMSNPDTILKWMSRNIVTSFIECQYAGDGPGPDYVTGDADMRHWLNRFWSFVAPIGKTLVQGRNKERTIWMCTNK